MSSRPFPTSNIRVAREIHATKCVSLQVPFGKVQQVSFEQKIILAAGDAKQLSPMKALTSTKNHEYMNEFLDSM